MFGDRAEFRRYIEGRELPDFGSPLARAGLLLRTAHPGAPALGPGQLQCDSAGAVAVGPTLIGTGLYGAGVDDGTASWRSMASR